SDEDYYFGRKFAKEIEKEFHDISIRTYEKDFTSVLKGIDSLTDEIVYSLGEEKIYSGELATRLIDLITLEVADKSGHCAIDSTNGTEIVLGEFVIGGGCECLPLVDFYKSQVYDIAEIIGVPEFVIARDPINSTFGSNKIKNYFGEITDNYTSRDVYNVLDPVLYSLYDKKLDPIVVSKMFGHSLKFVKKVYRRIKNQEHRRKIPWFALNDRVVKLERFIKEMDNKELERYL
ncbi:MAG: hypothetical protein GXO63_00510, partial [Candidatus Micrarchaeota archaeon]|nr:hypothetical protein [Candidatus Micrarchaeota archaeon]